MRYLVVSDIHGNEDSVKIIRRIVEEENIDKVILLGDLYHNGFIGSANQEVVDTLNNMAGIIIALRGNCDSDYDLKLANFIMERMVILTIKEKVFMFTHGDLYDINNIPFKIDYFVHGHHHQHFIKRIDDVVAINVGSISYPRDNSKRSYMIIDDKIIIKDIDNNVIEQFNFWSHENDFFYILINDILFIVGDCYDWDKKG